MPLAIGIRSAPTTERYTRSRAPARDAARSRVRALSSSPLLLPARRTMISAPSTAASILSPVARSPVTNSMPSPGARLRRLSTRTLQPASRSRGTRRRPSIAGSMDPPVGDGFRTTRRRCPGRRSGFLVLPSCRRCDRDSRSMGEQAGSRAGRRGPQTPRPLQALNDYLDHLDQAEPPVPAQRRILAALGPRKLELARDRSAGAILLLVTPAYTSAARRILGGQSALVIDQMLVLDTDATRARQTARRPLRFLSGLRGYRASFARMGFTDADIAGLSDTLVDRLVIWGDAETITAQISQHLRAGADHVMLHVLSEGNQPGPIAVARRLAGRLPR